MKKPMILVVDDEPRLIKFLRANLESVGYKVVAAYNGVSALDALEAEQPDLIVLDIVLPGMDGFEVCRRVREFSDVPILMLTAKAEEADKVKGLNLGADDYLTKPFGAEELLARVGAVLRRTKHAEEVRAQSVLTFGDITIDFARRQVRVRDKEIELTPTEYKLLSQLMLNSGRVMFHEELLNRVWGANYKDEVEYLRVYIRYLREKIEEDPSKPKHILSKPGVGYMFTRPEN